jgi:hypothetical protein
MRKTSFVTLGWIVLSACDATRLTTTGPGASPPGGPCDFEILTAIPSGGYVERGVVNAHLGDYGSNAFSTLADFKKAIAPYVCRAGGDMAVAQANGDGIYISATILKATAAPSTPPPPAGCEFDTQCKGERVCVKGACVGPSNR